MKVYSSSKKRLHSLVREQQHNTHFAHTSTTIPKLKTFSLQLSVLFLAVVY